MGGTSSCRCSKECEINEMDLNKEKDSLIFQNLEVKEQQDDKSRSNFSKNRNSLQSKECNGILDVNTSKQIITSKNNYSNSSFSKGNFFQVNQDQMHQKKISNTNQSINFNDSSNETIKDEIEFSKTTTGNIQINNSNKLQLSSKEPINNNNYDQLSSNKNLNSETLQEPSDRYNSTTDIKTSNNVNFTNAAGVLNQNISRSNSLNSNPSKKYSNFNTNSIISGSKLPLEVINEIHDIEKDSHGEGWSTNLHRLNSNSEIKENNVLLYNNFSNENEIPEKFSNSNNQRIISGEECGIKSNSNANIVDKIRDINMNPNQNLKNNNNLHGSSELKSSFLKKNKNTAVNITSIIPEHRLLYSSQGK
jgi:hypothetical protein